MKFVALTLPGRNDGCETVLLCVFSFDFLDAFCEEVGSDLLPGEDYEN